MATFVPDAYAERSVQGRVVVVTGASRGMGHFLASQLCGKGARVVAVARSVSPSWVGALESAASAGGGRVDACTCDVSNVEDVRALFGETLPGLGIDTIDVLVTNSVQ